jgi:hypothetical protein
LKEDTTGDELSLKHFNPENVLKKNIKGPACFSLHFALYVFLPVMESAFSSRSTPLIDEILSSSL